MPGTRLAIIGGGASATFLVAHLLKSQGTAPELHWFEMSGDFGPGVAYSTSEPLHLLNVPAARMSVYADEPEHFLNWLKARSEGTPITFQRRAIYREYLKDSLAKVEAASDLQLIRIRERVRAVERSSQGWQLEFGEKGKLECDQVVLATGNPPAATPPNFSEILLQGPSYIGDPWKPNALHAIAADEPVLLLGTGLTMIDAALTLVENGRRAPLTAVSRRGLLPISHPESALPAVREVEGTHPREVLRAIRERAANGENPLALVDSLRARSPALWISWSPKEKRRFIRHLRPYWDIYRHRIAGEVAARIQKALSSGALVTRAGRVMQAWEARSGRFGAEVAFLPRGQTKPEILETSRIINCTGPDASSGSDRLLRELMLRGHARAHPCGVGIELAPGGFVIDAQGRAQQDLHALGPVGRGAFWECNAIPEIRTQAAALARLLRLK